MGWPSCGLMFHLAQFSDADIENATLDRDWHMELLDPHLSECLGILLGRPGDQTLKVILSFYPLKTAPSLESLQARLSQPTVYRKETAVDFHHLFLATFFAFAGLLCLLSKVLADHQNKCDTKVCHACQRGYQDVEQQIITAYISAGLTNESNEGVRAATHFILIAIWTFASITCFTALKLHLTLLTNYLKHPLQMPFLHGQDKYDKFFQQWILSRIPMEGATGGEGHSRLERSDTNEDDALEHWLEEEDGKEQKQLICEGKPTNASIFCRWITLFITPFEAVWTLEKHCSKLPQDVASDVRITLLKVH